MASGGTTIGRHGRVHLSRQKWSLDPDACVLPQVLVRWQHRDVDAVPSRRPLLVQVTASTPAGRSRTPHAYLLLSQLVGERGRAQAVVAVPARSDA
jgi:hypothetical protein